MFISRLFVKTKTNFVVLFMKRTVPLRYIGLHKFVDVARNGLIPFVDAKLNMSNGMPKEHLSPFMEVTMT